LVNVLGVILGVAVATESATIVIIAAIAAAFAESISMAAVAYTSFKAEREYYQAEVAREKREMATMPNVERSEVRDVYWKLGFRGALLDKIVKHIASNKKRWLKVMMEQELGLSQSVATPRNIAAVVGISAIIGSFIPVIPFLLFPVKTAIWTALFISTVVLFFVGMYKAKTTVGNPVKSGLELAFIGMLAAIAGYVVGSILGATVVG
jgi:VIT1/CCC1 family predicted Fe2+/Mn2+ transporter